MTLMTASRAEPTECSATPAEREALRQLAEAALGEMLATLPVVGATSSGRTKVDRTGPMGPAATAWFALQEQLS